MALPVADVLPDLLSALASRGVAVLAAPPGAGKTTHVPLALLQAGAFEGRLLMLEPRRLAARGAAARMAETLGEPIGQTVGYRMRGARQTSDATRIEVVTEGILTAMLQSDPELSGVGCVIFDEFHERSLQADLGLALTWEVRSALRPDLQVLVMSATLDTGPVAALLEEAPIVASEGRSHPVQVIWRDRPPDRSLRLEAQIAQLVGQAMEETQEGSCLVFLPGVAEIQRVSAALQGRLPADARLHPLYGAMDFAAQRRAVAPPAPGQRHVILATVIAETSLTLPDVRVVVDAGLARRARHDPARAMSRLVTEPASRAEIVQRAGRAGRVAPGRCYRNWTQGEESARPPFAPPEIAIGDLTALALDLAAWGDPMGQGLRFLTPPAPGPLARARDLLAALGALDATGVTAHGQRLAKMPLHPRLAHMVLSGGPGTATLAALLEARDPMPEAGVDAQARLVALRAGRQPWAKRITAEAKRLRRFEGGPEQSAAAQAALAFPDRIGLRRPGAAPRWQLSGGTGARMEAGDALAQSRLIVAVDLDGDRREARIRQAFALEEAELRALYADQITWADSCHWDDRAGRVQARRQERFGALVLDDRLWPDAPPQAIGAALRDGIRARGIDVLNWTPKARRLRARLALSGLRDVSDAGLLAQLDTWAAPFLTGITDLGGLQRFDPREALAAWLMWEEAATLEHLAPQHYTTPLGRKVEIDYGSGQPEVSLRLQEVFGETSHPVIGQDRTPLRMVLLSPGATPIQVTQDLPGFWQGSYAEVRKDMRGRYPKHPWPEDPRTADPTLRAKPRK